MLGFIEEIVKDNGLGVVNGRNAPNHILLMTTFKVHRNDLLRHFHVAKDFLSIIYHSNKLWQKHYYLELVPLCFPPLTIPDL